MLAVWWPPDPTSGADACTPRTHGFWRRQCLAFSSLPPGPARRAGPRPGDLLDVGEIGEALRRVEHQLRGSDLASARDALTARPLGSAGERTGRALVALLLDRAVGFLGAEAELLVPERGAMTGEDAAREVGHLIAAGDCLAAEQLALRVSSGAACRRAVSGRRR